MMATAVRPIDAPINILLIRLDVIAWRTGEWGNSYNTPKTHAETMNAPSRPASIKYSGQWARRASTAADVRCSGSLEAATVSARLPARGLIDKLCSALFMDLRVRFRTAEKVTS